MSGTDHELSVKEHLFWTGLGAAATMHLCYRLWLRMGVWQTAAGSATATFAARLARLPTISSVHGSHSPRLPIPLVSRTDVDAATTMPSTLSGMNIALYDASPCRSASSRM